MFRKLMIMILSVSVLVSLGLGSRSAVAKNSSVHPMRMGFANTQSRRFGPYATLRRANEVANYARRLGYNARVVYGGSLYGSGDYSRVYYVDVWR